MLEGKKCKLMKIYVSEDAKHEGLIFVSEVDVYRYGRSDAPSDKK